MFDETESDSALEVRQRHEAPQARRESVQAPPAVPQPTPAAPDTEQAAPMSPNRRRVRHALFLLLPVALLGGGYSYVAGGRIMSTDDAYVKDRKSVV